MKRFKHTLMPQDQSGMAAIAITFVIMMVIGLIVLGFAQIIRRDQQQALDRHLSSRAFYAAESGINLAASTIKANPGIYDTTAKTTCGTDTHITDLSLGSSSSTQTEVSCLTVTTALPLLLYTVSQGQGQVIPLNAQAPGSITSLDLSWQSTTANSTTSYAGCGSPSMTLPAAASWTCRAPLLRIDLVPTSGALARASLDNNVFTAFLYPSNGAGTISVGYATGSANQVMMTQAPQPHCSTSSTMKYHCTVTITGLGGTAYSMRVMSYYMGSLVAVQAKNGGSVVNLVGAQATIDSTGRAQDVVRRIQARVPLNQGALIPDNALQAGAGICKLYSVVPGAAIPVTINGGAKADYTTTTPCN